MAIPVHFVIQCPIDKTNETILNLNRNNFIKRTIVQKDSAYFDKSATGYMKEKGIESISCIAEADTPEQISELKSYLYLYLANLKIEVKSFDVEKPDLSILKDKHIMIISICTAVIVFVTILVHNMALTTHELALTHEIHWDEVLTFDNILWNGITPVVAGLGAMAIELFFHKRERHQKIHSMR